MPDLFESVWKRGTDDAKRWLGMLRWRIAIFAITGLAIFVATRNGTSGPLVGIVTGVTTVLVIGAVGVLRAPYVLRDEARQRIQDMQGAANKREALTEKFRRGTKLFQATITEQQYDEWRRDQQAWTRDTSAFLAAQWGVAERELFERPRAQLPYHWDRALHEQHNREMLSINARLDAIRAILERAG
jgi:hypothetical protein